MLTVLIDVFSLLVTVCSGAFFDFHVVDGTGNFTNMEKECQRLGYDGLALLKSPEAFASARRIISRGKSYSYLWVGMRRDTGIVRWDDLTLPAPDMPLNGPSNSQLGRIDTTSWTISVGGGFQNRGAICGNHKNLPSETVGMKLLGRQPVLGSSALSTTHATSLTLCVFACGQDYLCRFAEFNRESSTCKTFGYESAASSILNPNTDLFIRNGF